jgi:hypothetical protein
MSSDKARKFFECSRKVDKIILYSLLSIVSGMQFEDNIVSIIKF